MIKYLLPRWLLDEVHKIPELEKRQNSQEERLTKAMSDLDTLNTNIAAIGTDVDAALSHLSTVEAALAAAQAAQANNQPVDLSEAIAATAAIRAKLEGASDTAAVVTAPAPSGSGNSGTVQPSATDTSGEAQPVG